MRHLTWALAVVALAWAWPAAGFAQQDSWKGQTVIIKEDTVQFFAEEPGAAPVLLGELRHLTYRVKDEKDGKLLVRQKGVDGWIDKDKVLPIDQALDYFSERIRMIPQAVSYYNRRAEIYRLKKDLDSAIKDLDEAIRLVPQEPAFFNNRGTMHAAKKQYDQAIKDYDEALRLKADQPFTLLNRGHTWLRQKDPDKAFKDFNEAAQLDPRDPNAHYGRGMALSAKKQYEAALACWDQALHIDPEHSPALNNKAWLFATCPDDKIRNGAQAIELAKKACTLTDWKTPGLIDTLAAAYAEAGQFAEAVRYQEQALKDATFAKDENAQRRLQLFRALKAYREE